jgi:hypothetical protein
MQRHRHIAAQKAAKKFLAAGAAACCSPSDTQTSAAPPIMPGVARDGKASDTQALFLPLSSSCLASWFCHPLPPHHPHNHVAPPPQVQVFKKTDRKKYPTMKAYNANAGADMSGGGILAKGTPLGVASCSSTHPQADSLC